MDEQRTPHLNKYLPLVALTTLWVAVCPTFAVWLLRDAGVIASPIVSILLASALALAASYVGGAIWKTRPGAGDLLFSDLLIWGWLRRRRSERQLANTVGLLAGIDATRDMSREQREQMLLRLAASLEAADPHTHGHSRRVARHAVMIAKRMGLSRHEIDKVRTAAALHDIGKLDTPREILQKHGRLTDDEFGVIKQHPGRSADLVSILGDPELSAIVRHHHERIDGTGYPDELKGEEIPLAARIVSVADVFDAITSTRPYRPARPHKEALAVLTNEAGAQLDADAVRAFQSCYAGRRPLALWAMLTNLPEKLFVWLGSGANTVAGSVAGAMATTAVASAVAAGAIASPLVSSPHLKAATTTRPATSATAAPPSQPASTASNAFAAAALKQPDSALVNAGTHALASSGNTGKGKSSASSAPKPRPLTASQPGAAPASSQSAGGASAGTGSSAPARPSTASPAGSPSSGSAGGQGSASGAGGGSSSGNGQSNASHGSTTGNQGNGKGSGSAGSQGTGGGQANSGGQGNGSGNGGQGQGSGSAGSQGQNGGSGQTQGSGNGQGNSSTGQGRGSSSGQGAGNGQAQGGSAGQGQGNASGTAQSQVTTGAAQSPTTHGKSADQVATHN